MEDQQEVLAEEKGGRRFSEFYEKWMVQLEDILHQLLKAINSSNQNGARQDGNCDEIEIETLVSNVTTHQKQFYTVKWAAAHEDVLAFYAPTWLSPLEITYSWITGWKPSVAFRLIDSLRKRPGSNWPGSEEDQMKKMGELRVKIRMEEDKVEREMERQQVALGDRRIVELAKLASRCGQGANGSSSCGEEMERLEEMVEVAMKGLMGGLEKVMKAADCVRLKTLKGVLDILNPKSNQCVEFLAAAYMLQIQLRKWGYKDQSHLVSTSSTSNGLSLSLSLSL